MSKFAPKHHVLEEGLDACLVLEATKWGVLVWELELLHDDGGHKYWSLLGVPSAIRWLFVVDIGQCMVYVPEPISPARLLDCGVVMARPGIVFRTSGGLTFIQAALTLGSSIIAEDLQHLCARLGIEVKGRSSRQKLLELLTKHVYPDDHEEKLKEIEATASDRQVSIDNALEDDNVKVLDELTCHDKDFTVDVGTMQEKSKFKVARMERLVAPAAKCEQSAVF